jgi:ABC-type lipoprotein release transport system permease subunit
LRNFEKEDRKEFLIITIVLISIVAFAIGVAFLITKIVYLNHKEKYYSHKAIVIDNIEYNIKDTEFIYYYEGRALIIKLPNGDEIHTNSFKFKN